MVVLMVEMKVASRADQKADTMVARRADWTVVLSE